MEKNRWIRNADIGGQLRLKIVKPANDQVTNKQIQSNLMYSRRIK